MSQQPGRNKPPFSDLPIAKSIGQFLENRPRPLVATFGFALIVAIAAIDFWLTSLQISFLVFYLLPIFFITWFTGPRSGVIAAILCAIVNFSIDFRYVHTFPNPLELYASGVAALLVYLFMARTIAVIRLLMDHERELARTDYMTGAANRRAFYEAAELEIQRARRYSHPFTIAAMDLDNFKGVNDRFGHAAGDTVLRLAADTIKAEIRAIDMVARIGGDEFIILLPEADGEAAHAVVDRVQHDLLAALQKNGWPVTVSIGLATFVSPPGSTDEMMKKADELLYAAKHGGKNMIRQQVLEDHG